MGLHLFFLPYFPGAMFIQGATFIPDSRVSVHEKGTFMPSSSVFIALMVHAIYYVKMEKKKFECI